MDQARYNCSATSTLTRKCGNVSRDSDQMSSTSSRQLFDNPSGPPISICMWLYSFIHCFILLARSAVLHRLPSRSRAMSLAPLTNCLRIPFSSSLFSLFSESFLNLFAIAISLISRAHSRGIRFWYSVTPSLIQAGGLVPAARSSIFTPDYRRFVLFTVHSLQPGWASYSTDFPDHKNPELLAA